MDNWNTPTLIDVPSFQDSLGNLGVIEKSYPFPFSIKRIYFLYGIPSSATRGSHAHKELHQLIIALNGSFTVTLDNGTESKNFELSKPNQGLTVPPGYWRTLTNFTSGSVGLVLASREYETEDYIRDYDEFKQWASNRK